MEPDAVDEAVYDDGVAPYPRIERRKPREAQKLLRLVQRGPEAEAQADEARARGVPPPGENLVDVYLAHAGLLGEGGFGYAPLLKEARQEPLHAAGVELVAVGREEFVEAV